MSDGINIAVSHHSKGIRLPLPTAARGLQFGNAGLLDALFQRRQRPIPAVLGRSNSFVTRRIAAPCVFHLTPPAALPLE
jgi:hypothetical protein